MASILIVEDELLVAADLRETLTSLGYTVPTMAASGEDALDKIARYRPDLVLMDMMLKGPMDGVAAAARVRTDHGIPVIFLTAYADEESLQRAKATEPYGYLIKPFEDRELRSTIEVALHKHATQRAIADRDRWFATTLSSIGDGVVTTDREERVTFLNHVAEAMTGWTQQEAVGRTLAEVFDIVHETSRQRAANPVTRALREGTVVGLANHTVLLRRGGGEVAIEDSAAPIIDDRGDTHGVVLVFRDATDERQARRLLEESRREMYDLVEHLPDAVIVLQEGRIVYANPAWIRCLGYDFPGDFAGRDLVDFLHPDDRETERERQAALDAGELGPRELRFQCRNGREVVLEVTPGHLSHFQGMPAVLKVARDVTEQRAFQMRLAQTDRLIAVGTMSAGVAHEINNPLAFVLSNVEYVASEIPRLVEALEQRELRLAERFGGRALAEAAVGLPVGTARRLLELGEALDDARKGAERVRAIVRDLKTFSRASDDANEAVELRPVIESTLTLAFNEIRHHARLVKDYEATPVVFANPSRLGQVILNLLLNAAQAITEGNAEGNEIRLTTRTDEQGRAVVEVRDTGGGIPPENLRSIFDPFFTTKAVGGGTGLGLSICHSIVTAMGGTIEVESVVGRGSTFRVTLPAASTEAPALRPPSRPDLPSVRRGKILVVDDELAVVTVIKRLLGGDHDVTAITEARAGLAEIDAGTRYDVIICDLMMPEMTGIELYETLLAKVPDQAGRMIFLTGGAFTGAAHSFLDRVPNMRLEKPFDSKVLRAIVADRLR